MPLSDDKLVEMAENVAVTRKLVENHDEAIKKLDGKVDTMQTDISDLRLAWEAEDTQRTEVRESVKTMAQRVEKVEENCSKGLLAQLTPKDWKELLKIIGIIIAMLMAGSAGGQGITQLVQALLGM